MPVATLNIHTMSSIRYGHLMFLMLQSLTYTDIPNIIHILLYFLPPSAALIMSHSLFNRPRVRIDGRTVSPFVTSIVELRASDTSQCGCVAGESERGRGSLPQPRPTGDNIPHTGQGSFR